jgi:DNA-binding MarR family transcriptional regulator
MSNGAKLSPAVTRKVGDTCLCFHVQRAARALARNFDDAFRPLGLTNHQFSLMMSLNRPQPPAMREVAQLLGLDRTTLTAALKSLERRRLVRIRTDRADRRNRRLLITRAGLTLLAKAYPLWKATHAEIEARLAPSDPEQLRTSLLRLAFDRTESDAGGLSTDRT